MKSQPDFCSIAFLHSLKGGVVTSRKFWSQNYMVCAGSDLNGRVIAQLGAIMYGSLNTSPTIIMIVRLLFRELQQTLASMQHIQLEKDTLSKKTEDLEKNLQVRRSG